MAGKGSAPRKGANNKLYYENYDKIFGQKQQQQPNIPSEQEKQIKKEQAQDPKNG